MAGADLMTQDQLTQKRSRNNIWVGLSLLAFVALVFAITIAKMMAGHNMEAFDHVVRPQLVEEN